jgi:hypothetical protein
VISVAAQKPSRPLYAEFLARVIEIEAVQCYRAAVTDDHTAQFFAAGRRPGLFGDFQWSLDAPEAFSWGPLAPATSEEPAPVSLPMQHAWDAAVAAFAEFIAALVNGELIASGVHPATGVRCEIDPAEWARTGLILNVRDGDLIEVRDGKRTVRWTAIVLRAAKQRRQGQPRKKRGHGYDWDACWIYAMTLRAENRWDWEEHRRDKKQPLPALHKAVEDEIRPWFAARGNVPDISDIRRNIVAPLYAGKLTWARRKR